MNRLVAVILSYKASLHKINASTCNFTAVDLIKICN